MPRRTQAEVDGHARAHERVCAKRHADVFCKGLDMMVTLGRLTAEEAALTKAQILGFADALLGGLHIEDHETPEISRYTRLMLEAHGMGSRANG